MHLSRQPPAAQSLQGSAEPEAPAVGPTAAGGEGAVMGMNPLVGHKVDRYWDVRARQTRAPHAHCSMPDPAVPCRERQRVSSGMQEGSQSMR